MPTITEGADHKVDEIYEGLIVGQPLGDDTDLSLDEFVALYQKIGQRINIKQRVDIVLQNDRAFVQFTDLPPGNGIVYVKSKRRLTPQDFSRTVANAVFHGDVLASTFREQIREDRANILITGVIGLLFAFLLFTLGNSVASSYADYLITPDQFPATERAINIMVKISEMLLTSATLFLSIFLVFTVAQSAKLQEDVRLFDTGLLHKFERDDRLITIVAIASLVLSVLNVTLLGLPVSWNISAGRILGYAVTLNKLSLISPLITGLTIGLLIYCFLALLYYLKRMMLITNRDMSARVLERARRTVPTNRGSYRQQSGNKSGPQGTE